MLGKFNYSFYNSIGDNSANSVLTTNILFRVASLVSSLADQVSHAGHEGHEGHEKYTCHKVIDFLARIEVDPEYSQSLLEEPSGD